MWNVVHALAILLNIILSVMLVFCNKALVTYYNFRFMTVLSCMHFIAAFMMCACLVLCGCIPFKSVNNYFHIFRIALVRTFRHVLQRLLLIIDVICDI